MCVEVNGNSDWRQWTQLQSIHASTHIFINIEWIHHHRHAQREVNIHAYVYIHASTCICVWMRANEEISASEWTWGHMNHSIHHRFTLFIIDCDSDSGEGEGECASVPMNVCECECMSEMDANVSEWRRIAYLHTYTHTHACTYSLIHDDSCIYNYDDSVCIDGGERVCMCAYVRT